MSAEYSNNLEHSNSVSIMTSDRRSNARLQERRYTIKELEEEFVFKIEKSDSVIDATANYIKKYFKPTPNCMKSFFLERLPIISLLFNYDFKNNLFKDFIAGITVIFLNNFKIYTIEVL